jgi:hypothetical protein
VNGELELGTLRCSVVRLEDEVGTVPVVEDPVVVEADDDVLGGGAAGVEPYIQLHALLTRTVLLAHP